ncbi:Transcriptional regulatory protein CusR [compost metagenome]
MRILIVDDATISAELTAECLMMEPGVSVQIASNGATALRIMAVFQPNAVLLDIDLPDASGLDLAPQLKAMNEGRASRIIIFSGSVRKGAPSFLPDGVDAWLTKPAHLDELLACIFRDCAPAKTDSV